MASLMDSVKGMLTDAVVRKASDLIGIESSNMTSAIGKFLPAIIGGLISKGSTESGAGGLLDIFKDKGLSDMGVDDLMGVFGNADKSSSMLEMGGDLLGSVFGNNQSGILDKLLGMTGLKKAGGSMLLKFLAPIVMRKLAGMVFKNGWGAKQLSGFLGEQKSSIAGMLPGMEGLMGFADNTKAKAAAAGMAAASSGSSSGRDSEGGSNGWIKWLIPLVLAAAVGWFLSQNGCNGAKSDTTSATNTEMTGNATTTGSTTEPAGSLSSGANDSGSTNASSSTINTSSSMDFNSSKLNDNGDIIGADGKVLVKGGSYGMDGSGNLVGDDGNIILEKAKIPDSLLAVLKSFLGQYSGTKLAIDDAGNLVDPSGKVIHKAGEFTSKDGFYYDSSGKKLGRIWGKIVQAIKDAANKGMDAMKGLFADMMAKKAGAKSEYSLSDIEFKEDGNRITSFSKVEVEGLAAALKENKDGKIIVRGFTNDGKNDKANKKLSADRAQVVHDMLVTLGVSGDQISFKGMGSGDNKIEVTSKE